MSSVGTIRVEVFRYRPDEDSAGPGVDAYDVPLRPRWVVLDALNYIKDEIDGTLSFRWSCRMGICGSCGAMVNGVPVLTCAAFLERYRPGPIRVEPLAGFPVERDLVSQLDDFVIDKLPRVLPWLVRQGDGEGRGPAEPLPQTPEQRGRYERYSRCINCMLCYAACPVYVHDPRFLGPAAIALGQRYNLDSRDDGRELRLARFMEEAGIWDCTFVGECSTVCPKDVDPAGAIQRAKLAGSLRSLRRLLP